MAQQPIENGGGGATNLTSVAANFTTVLGGLFAHIKVLALLANARDFWGSQEQPGGPHKKNLDAVRLKVGGVLYDVSVGQCPPLGFTSGPLDGSTQRGCFLIAQTVGNGNAVTETQKYFVPYSILDNVNTPAMNVALLFP